MKSNPAIKYPDTTKPMSPYLKSLCEVFRNPNVTVEIVPPRKLIQNIDAVSN